MVYIAFAYGSQQMVWSLAENLAIYLDKTIKFLLFNQFCNWLFKYLKSTRALSISQERLKIKQHRSLHLHSQNGENIQIRN